ncbi:coiled-coil domain-containing protein 137 [Microplitis mediator]|uniref:coiled-coil domain-containing protein 137 n=1 Tax=Microplitis mediator TaxID=375433 RepID=UPI00255254C0|nr:coiled-coil domain-containing protein 137 [Microplitis mediator]
MGRKIPGKKHKGVKDPDKQRAKRWAEIKDKVDAPPVNIEDQPIPKSLERIMSFKSNDDNKIVKRKKPVVKNKNKLITVGSQNTVQSFNPKAKPEKVVPVFSQRPGESDSKFWHRVNGETQMYLKEAEFENKFNVQVVRDPVTGKVEGLQKKPKDEIDELLKLKMKHKNIGKKKKVKTVTEPKLTKVQKRKLKMQVKKDKKLLKCTDDLIVKDKVEFGEVAHAPPEIKIKPKTNKLNKPAKKELLLHSLLKDNKIQPTSIDKKGKRKNLPSAERRILENHRNEAVEAYKLLKTRRKSSEITSL